MEGIVRMPRFDASTEEGRIVEWKLDEGSPLSDGATLAVVESGGTISEIEASGSGVFRRILVAEKEIVEPGEPIGLVVGVDGCFAKRGTEPRPETDGGRSASTREVHVESDTAGRSGRYRTVGIDRSVAFDEPVGMGGQGSAPTPVEHLLGALGSCLSLSVRAMAARDGVAVGHVGCAVDGSPSEGPLESIAIELEIESDASEDALDRVVTKAERACYVERALADDLDVSVTWRFNPRGADG